MRAKAIILVIKESVVYLSPHGVDFHNDGSIRGFFIGDSFKLGFDWRNCQSGNKDGLIFWGHELASKPILQRIVELGQVIAGSVADCWQDNFY